MNDAAAHQVVVTERAHDLPLLLTMEEAARLLGIGRTKTYDLVRRGEIIAVHIDRSLRVPRAELAEYVARLTRRASQNAPASDPYGKLCGKE